MCASLSPKAHHLYFINMPSLLGCAKPVSLQHQHILLNNALYSLQLFQTNTFLFSFSAMCRVMTKLVTGPYQGLFLLVLVLLSQVCISIQEDSEKHQLDMREQHHGCRLCEPRGHWSDTGILHRTQP